MIELSSAFTDVDSYGMWRVLNVVKQMSASLNQAAHYLEEALSSIDDEMTRLQRRLHADAHSLRTGIAGAELNDKDRSVLLATLDRMEQTAESVASFAHPQDTGDTAPVGHVPDSPGRSQAVWPGNGPDVDGQTVTPSPPT